MNKAFKMIGVIVGGVIGTCAVVWLLSTTAGGAQQASARGETFGIFLGVTIFVGIGILVINYVRKK